jgi:hypothetical protein
MSLVAGAADCGFSVAGGDPEALWCASSRLQMTADGLDEHAGTVRGAALVLLGSWNGLAALAYQDLSQLIAEHFHDAAGASRTASATLRRYSLELARCQQEGRTAVAQAEHFLQEIRIDTARLEAAVQAVRDAESELRLARGQATRAAAAGPLGAHAAAAAEIRASAAQTALASAQADEQAAIRALESAREELAYWQARGRAAWEEAQSAGAQATGSVAVATMTAPPVAALAAPPALAFSQNPSGGKVAPRAQRPRKVRAPAHHHSGVGSGVTVIGGAPPPAHHHPGVGSGVTVIGGSPPPPHHSGGANLPNPPRADQGSGTGSPAPHPKPATGKHKPSKPRPPGTGSGTTIVGY